ncbi:MAG: hypothetical protein EXS42_02085 [Lacunisphaera sp.]|nr:hypothetical protein [Lacunisphaera sp.]
MIEELRLALSKKDFGGLDRTVSQHITEAFRPKIDGLISILGSTKLAKPIAFSSFAPHGVIP